MVCSEIWLLPFCSSSRIECYHFGIWLVAVMVVAVLVVAVLGVTVLFCYRSDCYSFNIVITCHEINRRSTCMQDRSNFGRTVTIDFDLGKVWPEMNNGGHWGFVLTLWNLWYRQGNCIFFCSYLTCLKQSNSMEKES